MLSVVHSNRFETLSARLATLVAAPRATPLEAQTVVVPNEGIGRWLWMQLASQGGISANLDFQLPGSFIWRVLHELVPGVAEVSPYDRETMAWRLHSLLRAARDDPSLAGMGQWRDTDDDRLRFELARRLAHQFDQYIVYRPDWIESWARGEEHHWQAQLWRRLAAQTGAPSWLALREQLEQLTSQDVAGHLPQQVCLFGIPLLSPGYLDVLRWLGEHIDVHLLLPNPCREHWAHIVPERDFARVAGVEDEKELYIESGNSLLASWGGQARDLIDQVGEFEADIVDDFVEAPGHTLLHAIQNQVLDLSEPDGIRLDPQDCSVQVHACHSPMREVEVLHDQLLALFDADASLRPSDIIVMTPDIERYAPCIDAVFAGGEHPVDYRIADRDARSGMALVDAFLVLLALGRERFDANEVLALLEIDAVARRFGLADSDLAVVRNWVRRTGVRWGLDADSRTGLEGAAAKLHTWRDGIDRMLLGLAIPAAAGGLYDGIEPFGEIEGSDALALGALAEYVDRLAQLHAGLLRKRPAADWTQWLNIQFARFFEIFEAEEPQAQVLRNAFAALSDCCEAAGFDGRLQFDVIADFLQAQLAEAGTSYGFLGHGVTFCRLVAMRNVPMRVIALLGMDYDLFPRQRERIGFDLIAQRPRRGDRSRRDDDRFGFLECVLNARDVLYISYNGRGVRDDEPRPPSVVVSELLEYAQAGFTTADGASARQHIETTHPLHPFSPRYFDAGQCLFSYSQSRCAASAATGNDEAAPFVQQPLESTPEALREVSIGQLVEFFGDPCKFWLRRRLGVYFDTADQQIDTSDPLHLDGLSRWKLHDEMVRLLDEGAADSAVAARMRVSALVPGGPLGEILIAREQAQCRAFIDGLRELWPDTRPELIAGTVTEGGFTIHAALPVQASGYYDRRHGNTRIKDYVSVWLYHLMAHLLAPSTIARRATWYARDRTFVLREVEDPRDQLAQLLRLYEQGLGAPLPLFPTAGLAYVKTILAGKTHERALDEAAKRFVTERAGGTYRDDQNPYIRRLYRHDPPLERCAQLAMQIVSPILAHLEELE